MKRDELEKIIEDFFQDNETSRTEQPDLFDKVLEIFEYILKVSPDAEIKGNKRYIAVGKYGSIFKNVYWFWMGGKRGNKIGCFELKENEKSSAFKELGIDNILTEQMEKIKKLILASIYNIYATDHDFYRAHLGERFVKDVDGIDLEQALEVFDVRKNDENHQDEAQFEEENAQNLIYYGPPGTGKTHQLQQLQQQFTETLADEDLNLRLQEKLKNRTWAEVIALIFLDENRMLRVPEIVEHRFFQTKLHILGRSENIAQTAWGTLQRHAPVESTTVKYSIERRASPALFDKDTAGLWQLLDSARADLGDLQKLLAQLNAPAQAGQTICRYRSVTFHQSYGYEDFIEGLRPTLHTDDDSGQIGYEIREGIFLELCREAKAHPEHHYALFIDEINRGNVSRIFGELISLIELDKREGEENALSVVLPYSREPFSVPRNVSLIGSMNSADRSLTPLDTALRRRFEFVEVMPEPELLAADVDGVDLRALLLKINQRIEALIGRDHVIGHAYFLPATTLDDLRQVFLNRIIPLLAEYFFEDWEKIRLVLGDNQKTDVSLHMVQEIKTDEKALFGAAKINALPRHQVNPELRNENGRFSKPTAYQLIYDANANASSQSEEADEGTGEGD